ncbi:hypothetical protein M9Y10_028406 [Tritrichomonas musculus]|uniref:Uncharacterized protein n=1 Tax=Tritrichomonas musculus TaxID=1915356 RepID=A0ABR2KMJ6_9EUKA
MASITQTVTFTPKLSPPSPKAQSMTPLSPGIHGPAFHGTGMVEPYHPDTEQLQMTMQRNLEADLQRRIDLFEEHKRKYLERSDRYYHKQLEVNERHQALDDRLFNILSEATSEMLNTRYLDNREKHAYEILTEPIDDLSYEEANVNRLEAAVKVIYEKLDNDDNDEIEKQLQQDEKDCNELILRNSQRNNDIALRQSKLQQGKLIKPLINPHYQKNSGVFNPSIPEQKPMTESLPDSMSIYQKTIDHLNQINQNIDESNSSEIDNRKNHKESELSYEDKLQHIQDLLEQVEEVEKYESLVSELQFAVTTLRFDHYDNLFKIRNLGIELASQGYDVSKLKNIDLSDLSVNTSVFENISDLQKRVDEKQAKINEIDEYLKKRREQHEKNVQAVYEFSQTEKSRAAEVDEIMRELNKVAADVDSKNDIANSLADKLFGEKVISITSSDFLSKINEIKQNLDMLKIDTSEDDEEYLTTQAELENKANKKYDDEDSDSD